MRDSVVRFFRLRTLQARARFAALIYLAVAGLVLTLLGGVIVTSSARPPQASETPASPPAMAEAPLPPLRQLQSQDPPAAAAAAKATASPSPTPTEPPVVVVQGQPIRPQATQTAKPAPPALVPPRTLTKGEVGITDLGIFPKVLSVMAGGTVTWTNMGSLVHTATGAEGAGSKLDSGGLAAGQSYSLVLFDPGIYHYTSAPDCVAASNGSGFDCSGASIRVLPPVVPALSAPSTAAAVGLFAPPAANVQITDSGFVPDHVVVKADGWITWTNQGSAVHTATGAGQLFDTGGLAPHQSGQVRFRTPGVFAYTSAPDCGNGNHRATFNCSAPFTIIVRP